MSIGALAVVEEWSDAVNRRDGDRLMHLSHEAVQSSVRGAGSRVGRPWRTG